MKHSLFSLPLAAAFVTLTACGGNDEPAQTAQNVNQQQYQPGQPGYVQPGQPGYVQPGQPGYTQPTTQPGYTQPTTQPGYTQPTATAAPTGAAPGWTFPGLPAAGGTTAGATAGGATGGTAQPLDPNVAAAATSILGQTAASEAPGAAADGAVISGNFQAGQTLEQTFNLQPGKCYTVVGDSIGPGSQLDAQIIITTVVPGMQLPANSASGTASMTGSKVVLGAKTNCVKTMSPFPLTAKVVVTMSKGAGMAAAQLYSK